MDTTQKRAAETAALFASAVPVSVRAPWRADSCEAGALLLHCDRYPLNRWSDRFRDAFRVVLSAVLLAPSGSFAILQGDIRRPGGFRKEFLEANAKGPEAGFLTLDLAVESDYHPPRRRVPLGVLPLPLPAKISLQECYEAVDRPEWHNVWALNHPQYGPELMRRRWHAARVEYRRRRILAIAKNTSDYQEARRRYVKTLPRDPVIFPLNIPLLPSGSAIMLGVPAPSGARGRRVSASGKGAVRSVCGLRVPVARVRVVPIPRVLAVPASPLRRQPEPSCLMPITG